jgi:hypothetical protein
MSAERRMIREIEISGVWMLTQAISKIPANLWTINLALDLEDRELFLQAFYELGIGVG